MKDKEKNNSENAPAEPVTTNASTPITGNQREIRNTTQEDERLKKVIYVKMLLCN